MRNDLKEWHSAVLGLADANTAAARYLLYALAGFSGLESLFEGLDNAGGLPADALETYLLHAEEVPLSLPRNQPMCPVTV